MDNITILCPNDTDIETVTSSCPLSVKDETNLAFVEALSRYLLQQTETKALPELVALGFWLRKSNIHKQLSSLQGINKALGVVVHYTPANVDTMFVYSWVCSLLMGNCNIVRVASQPSAPRAALLKAINDTISLPEFASVMQRNIFIQYDRQSQVSETFSLIADARVIWGGDDTVNAIRAYRTKPRCRDISFANRYSAVLINGEQLKTDDDISKLAELLWRDSSAHGQQACSSPKVIFWVGTVKQQEALFHKLNVLAAKEVQNQSLKNNHLVFSQLILSQDPLNNQIYRDSICVISTPKLSVQSLDWHTGDGQFLICDVDKVNQIANFINEKLQTLSYWGVEKGILLKLAIDPSITGLCRIIPVGQALDFVENWDGYELFSQLSNKVEFR